MYRVLEYCLLFVIILLLSILLSNFNVKGIAKEFDFGKGMEYMTGDSTFLVKAEIVAQPRTTATLDITNDNKFHQESFIRRFRLRFGGFALSPELTYYFHLGFSNIDMKTIKDPETDKSGIVYDAYIEWNFAEGFYIQFGQNKLPGGLSRLMSLSTLNFLERSYCESVFNLFRDIGVQFRHQWGWDNILMREYFAFTNGDGVNWISKEGGNNYTGRVELLPLGAFENKGELAEMDVNKEESMKIMLGCALSYNDDAIRRNNTFGELLFKNVDLATLAVDFIWKYKGFSFFSEYYRRDQGFFPLESNYKKYAPNYITYNKDRSDSSVVFSGWGFSGQFSYKFDGDWCLAFRYSYVKPVEELITIEFERKDYTVGITRYLYMNKFKLQADFSYIETIKSGKLTKGAEGRFNVLLIL